MSDTLKRLRCFMQYGELFGSSLEYPVIKTVDGKVIGMCLEKDSPYVHAFVAAPEMLEALKSIVDTVWFDRLDTDLILTVEHVIAKAEGRQV
jgi:hypothetical protein